MSTIGIVVVSYNTKDNIRSCLKKYLPQMSAGDEIVVVDNQSTDGTHEMMRSEFPNVQLIVNPTNAGFSHACNVGYRATSTPLVLISNGDIEAPAGFIEAIRAKMGANPTVGILSPVLLSEEGKLIQMSWGWNLTFLGEFRAQFLSPKNVVKSGLVRRIVSRLQRAERRVPIVAGACMLLRREMLDKVGGMDEGFELYFEDADLCVRCWKAGYEVLFVPGVHVHHGLGQSGKSIRTKIELIYRQSQIYYYRKHNPAIERLLLKIYLALKFYVARACWRDRTFAHWFTGILFERRRLRLVDPI
jgi:GT2 family glycosyltransferase